MCVGGGGGGGGGICEGVSVPLSYQTSISHRRVFKEINTFEGMKVSHLALESKTDSN